MSLSGSVEITNAQDFFSRKVQMLAERTKKVEHLYTVSTMMRLAKSSAAMGRISTPVPRTIGA